jgi:serpin B
VEIPFRGQQLAMVFVLPPEDVGLAEFEQNLDGSRLSRLLAGLRNAPHGLVDLKLPRFEMRTPLPLNSPLRALGMKRAFGGAAEFAGIAAEQLFVSDVIHQAFVKVDEIGAEAAAATAIVMRKGGLATGDAFPFVADRPFLFAIVERSSGAILFFGRCVRP